MRRALLLGSIILAACGDSSVTAGALAVKSVEPSRVSARGGEALVINGNGFEDGAKLFIGDVEVAATVRDSGTLDAVMPPSVAGRPVVRVASGGDEARLVDGLEVEKLDLAFAALPSWQTPALPGPLELLAAAGDRLVVGGPWGLAELSTDPGGAFTTTLLHDTAVRAISVTPDGNGLAACVAGDHPLRWWTRTEGKLVAGPTLESNGSCDQLSIGDTAIGDPAVFASWTDTRGPRVVSWWPGGELRELATPALPGPVDALLVGDFDGDGDGDLVLSGRGEGAKPYVLNWIRESVRYEDYGGVPARDGVTRALVAFDVDHDGDSDLLGAGPGSDALWINDGQARFVDAAWQKLPFERSDGTSAAVGDLDRDGSLDIVLATPEGLDRLFLSGPDAYLDATPALGLETGLGGRAVALADLDHDHVLDVVTLAGGALRVRFARDAIPEP